MKNKIFAICVARLATPTNPNNPATIAIIKNMTAPVNIFKTSLSRKLQNSPPQQNRPFEPFCRSAAKFYSLEYVLGGGVRVAPRPRQTDSKSSIFLGRGALQFPLSFNLLIKNLTVKQKKCFTNC